jgi:Fe-S-cluster containining protein
MVAFQCSWCGKCCASYGDFIKIERQLTSRDYYCRYGIKNEMFLAHVEGDYIMSYPPDTNEGKPKKGCPFMQKNLSGDGFACAIYATRPQVCKEFRCYRMLIFDRDGHERGRIMARNDLRTTDETLERIWNEEIAPLPKHEVTRWEKRMIDTLAAHGYRVEQVEQEREKRFFFLIF